MGVLFPHLPFGLSSPTREEFSPLSWEYCYPLPAGFPRNRSPLKGNPPFQGTPSALGQEGVRGRRLYGAAMLCRLQCARFAKRMAHCQRTSRQPSALIRSPRRSSGGCAACERLGERLHSEKDNVVSGDITFGVFVKPSPKECSSLSGTLHHAYGTSEGNIWMQNAKAPYFRRGAYLIVRNEPKTGR